MTASGFIRRISDHLDFRSDYSQKEERTHCKVFGRAKSFIGNFNGVDEINKDECGQVVKGTGMY